MANKYVPKVTSRYAMVRLMSMKDLDDMRSLYAEESMPEHLEKDLNWLMDQLGAALEHVVFYRHDDRGDEYDIYGDLAAADAMLINQEKLIDELILNNKKLADKIKELK